MARWFSRVGLSVFLTFSLSVATSLLWREIQAPSVAGRQVAIPSTPVSIEGAMLAGSDAASVVLVEYADFQCPFCELFARSILPQIRSEYIATGRVQIAFRQFPLAVHTRAQRAAETAVCAGLAGKFWLMHDSLFAAPQSLEDGDLARRVRELGIAPSSFAECLQSKAKVRISTDLQSGRSVNVSGTPEFLIGHRLADMKIQIVSRLAGAQRISEFRYALNTALAER
jgi:protein-disulfide isomerase